MNRSGKFRPPLREVGGRTGKKSPNSEIENTGILLGTSELFADARGKS
jgi:hypothetical protein